LKIKEIAIKIPKIVSFKDILMFIGLFMAGKGLYMVYPPSMWLIIGMFLIYLGWPKRAVK
jgi:hypothetical protein